MNQGLATATIKQMVVLSISLLLFSTVSVPGTPAGSGERSQPSVRVSHEERSEGWDAAFSLVHIPSTADGVSQAAYFLSAREMEPMPLLVSLHTWSGDYTQADPLAVLALKAGWNYIHPDFRGPNRTIEACLSAKALSDIDDAIQYAIENGSVDRGRIFVVGVSGGGYATLGSYLRTRHTVRAWLAWVPISDLVAWFYESQNRGNQYAQDIIKCTSEDGEFDEEEARRRSPLNWDFPEKLSGRIEIYAGINDGYSGSVPISHSILFFNRLAEYFRDEDARLKEPEIIRLLVRGIDRSHHSSKLGDRDLILEARIEGASLSIFDGGHEMLADWCFRRLEELARE